MVKAKTKAGRKKRPPGGKRPTRAGQKKRQQTLLEDYMKAGFNRDIASTCKRTGVPRSTFYRWMEDDEDFRDAWEQLPKASIFNHLPGMVSAQIKQAMAGNTAAFRVLMDYAGLIRNTLTVAGPGGGPIPHRMKHEPIKDPNVQAEVMATLYEAAGVQYDRMPKPGDNGGNGGKRG